MLKLSKTELATLKKGLAKSKITKHSEAVELVKLWEKFLKHLEFNKTSIYRVTKEELGCENLTEDAKHSLSGIWPRTFLGYNRTMDRYDPIDMFLAPDNSFHKKSETRNGVSEFTDPDLNGSVSNSGVRSYHTDATAIGLDTFQKMKGEKVNLKSVEWKDNHAIINFNPSETSKTATSKLVFYGIELEVICRKTAPEDIVSRIVNKCLEGFCIIKSDSSLAVKGSTGFEVVTVPATYNRHKQAWKAFFDEEKGVAKYLKSWVTGKCGIHIHLSRESFTKPHLARFCAFFNYNSEFIKEVAGRSNEHYAPFTPTMRYQNIIRNEREGGLGRGAVYLGKEGGKTVEVRIFRGNTREKGFFKCLEFTDALFHYTKMCSWAYDKKLQRPDLKYEDFLIWLKRNPRDYSNLIDWLIEKDYMEGNRKNDLLNTKLEWSSQCA